MTNSSSLLLNKKELGATCNLTKSYINIVLTIIGDSYKYSDGIKDRQLDECSVARDVTCRLFEDILETVKQGHPDFDCAYYYGLELLQMDTARIGSFVEKLQKELKATREKLSSNVNSLNVNKFNLSITLKRNGDWKVIVEK